MGEEEWKEEKNRDRIVHCPKKYFLLSLRTKKTLVLRGVNNDLSVLKHMEVKKLTERLLVGCSLLVGKIYKGMVLITVFSVDIWGQLFKGMI